MCYVNLQDTIRYHCIHLLEPSFYHDFDCLELAMLSNWLGIRLFFLEGHSDEEQDFPNHVAWRVTLREVKLPEGCPVEPEETSEDAADTSHGNVLIVAKFLDRSVMIIAPGQKEVAESSLLDEKFKYWKEPREIREDSTSEEEEERKKPAKSSDKGQASPVGAGGEKTASGDPVVKVRPPTEKQKMGDMEELPDSLRKKLSSKKKRPNTELPTTMTGATRMLERDHFSAQLAKLTARRDKSNHKVAQLRREASQLSTAIEDSKRRGAKKKVVRQMKKKLRFIKHEHCPS